MINRSVSLLVLAHVCLSLGGMLIHVRSHPLGRSLYFWWSSPVDALSLIVLPFLFTRGSTVGWGYVLNAATVLIGTVGMTYFFLLNAKGPFTFSLIFLDSTFPYLLILWAKLPLAHVILRQMRPHGLPLPKRGCRE